MDIWGWGTGIVRQGQAGGPRPPQEGGPVLGSGCPPDGPAGWVPEGTNIICISSGRLARVFFCVSCCLLDLCGPAEPKEVSARESQSEWVRFYINLGHL